MPCEYPISTALKEQGRQKVPLLPPTPVPEVLILPEQQVEIQPVSGEAGNGACVTSTPSAAETLEKGLKYRIFIFLSFIFLILTSVKEKLTGAEVLENS